MHRQSQDDEELPFEVEPSHSGPFFVSEEACFYSTYITVATQQGG
jgi:hypothetical protein